MEYLLSLGSWLQAAVLIPVLGGSVFSLLCVWTAGRFFARSQQGDVAFHPPVTVLKPCYGLDRDMAENLKSICEQDYPVFQIVLSVQRLDDPCLSVLRDMEVRYPNRVTLAIESVTPTVNGKVQNMMGGLKHARHDHLVISDSDARVAPDYLARMIAPLANPSVGYVCSLYRAVGARTVPERLEVLGLNGDFVPSLIFASETGASDFCLGASTALRRADLDAIGGFPALADYLVEDYEMGRRLRARGLKFALIPRFANLIADYDSFRSWWSHWIYWDQNTKAAHPTGFALTVLTRAIPFALLFWALRGFDLVGTTVLIAAVTVRLGSVGFICQRYLSDSESVRSLWLLPARDVLGLVAWCAALMKQSFVWRGHRFGLGRNGRIIPRDVP